MGCRQSWGEGGRDVMKLEEPAEDQSKGELVVNDTDFGYCSERDREL